MTGATLEEDKTSEPSELKGTVFSELAGKSLAELSGTGSGTTGFSFGSPEESSEQAEKGIAQATPNTATNGKRNFFILSS